jgi:alpha-beta hydrolase superfamily lysophospholipase
MVLIHGLVLLGWLAEPSATAVAGAPAAADVYEMLLGGSVIATEESTRTVSAERLGLAGVIRLTPPGGAEGRLAQSAGLAPDGTPRSYELSVDAQGQQFDVKAAATDAVFTMSMTPRAAAAPAKSETVTVKPPVFLLDNNFASHLDLLTRSLVALGPNEEKTFTALVPQALQAFPATVRRTADGTGKLSGTTIATRGYALTIANVREELVARASDGALLHAAVPVQHFAIRRRGFEPAAPAAAAADRDPRETVTSVKSAAGPLPAILLIPAAERPVAAAIFLSGSGPNDADETIGPNKPFRDIARGLGDRGIATLRFDKRTHAVRDPRKLGNVQLKDEYYDDGVAALAQLRAAPGVDPKRIFVIGHSEGATVAPRLAEIDGGLRGGVLMAPAVRPIDELMIDQARFGAKLTGRSDAEIAETTQELRSIFAAIRDAGRADTPPFMGAPAAYWREILSLDLPAMVRASKIPLLVLQGDKDVQVRKDADFELLKQKAGTGEGRLSYRSFPDLNHLFMKVEHESTGAEYGIPGRVDPAVITAIADWILAR